MGRILVVDDDFDILRYCQTVLSESGHEVIVASEPQKALELISTHHIDLLALDILMPQMSGFEFLRTLKHFYHFKSPVLMLSRKRAPEDVQEALKFGATDYLCKPLDRDVFLGKVNSILDRMPMAPAATFAEGTTYAQATVSFPACVTAITEMGMTVKLNTPVPKDIMISVNTPVFREIGVTPPPLRVINCMGLTNDSHYSHQVYLSFVGLNEVAMQKIRKWITRQTGILRRPA